MKAIIFGLCMILATGRLLSQIGPDPLIVPAAWQVVYGAPGTTAIIHYSYVGGDEFEGTELDKTKWSNGLSWGVRGLVGSGQSVYFTEDNNNLEVANGKLKLIAKRESKTARAIPWEADNYPIYDNGVYICDNYHTFDYTAAAVTYRSKFKYGVFQVNMKISSSKGTWPAFWLYGGNPNIGNNEELDIIEAKGERQNQYHIDVHCPSGCSNLPGNNLQNMNWVASHDGGWVDVNGNLANGFNEFTTEWNPNACFWSINGNEFAMWLGSLDRQASLMINQSIASNSNGSFSGAPDANTPFPSAMEVEYVRIWARQPCGVHYNECNKYVTATSDIYANGDVVALGGTGCSYIVPQGISYYSRATNYIELMDGFEVDSTGNFDAAITNCIGPDYQRLDSSAGGIFNYDTFVGDSLSNVGFVAPEDTTSGGRFAKPSMLPNAEPEKKVFISLFPNPANDAVILSIEGSNDGATTLTILDELGRPVKRYDNITTKNTEVLLNDLSPGMYFFVINHHGAIINHKITIQR